MGKVRTRNLYDPTSPKSFKLSRSKIELYLECPRCFYLDRLWGINRPPSFPFNLNLAVDHLLKKEFDYYRKRQEPHPMMEEYRIQAVPLEHEELDTWRNNSQGIQFLHASTNFLVTGALDDLWVNTQDELIVIDYKATSKEGSVSIDAPWQSSYKRQMEVYQWLLKSHGYQVSPVGYFVYCNGIREREAFKLKLEFTASLIPYRGDDSWIEPLLMNIYTDLKKETPPLSSYRCNYCSYREEISKRIP